MVPGSSQSRPAAFCLAFFCRRGRRDLFFGSSFPFRGGLGDGLDSAGGAWPAAAAGADSFLSAFSFCFANGANLPSTVLGLHMGPAGRRSHKSNKSFCPVLSQLVISMAEAG